MFVRVKTTPNSPRKSVQIVMSFRKGDKVSQKIVRYVGIAENDKELEQLKALAESIRIRLEAGNQELLFTPENLAEAKKKQKRQERSEDFRVNLKNIIEEQRVISGIHDIYGKLFDELNYGTAIENPDRNKACIRIFRDVVLARIVNPLSKRGSVSMLEEDFGISLDLDRVYKMMDKLDETAEEKIKETAYKNTVSLFQEKIDIIFFDCTTLYFETFGEDELRKMGYSKDLKFNQPQVLLALMVTKEGLPVGYQVFEGSTYEGHTLIPALKELRGKYNLDKVILVADSAMLNKNNIAELEKEEFEYIVGSRLKNLPKELQEQILDHNNYKEVKEIKDDIYAIGKFNYRGKNLIVSYSGKRARKDANDRRKAIERLKKRLAKKKNPKEYLSNHGNKKYLKLQGEASIELDQEKIETDSRWDGLHGVTTNAESLTNREILKQYNNLWEVENAFRINKHDLKVRPIFHWKPSRVKAHLAIAFVAYALVKYLEYRIKLQYKKLSPEKIRQTLIRVQTSIIFDTKKRIRYGLPSRISMDAKKIYQFCQATYKLTPYIIKKMKKLKR